MTKDLQSFERNGWKIRTLEIDGDPWFVAADVCKALEIANSADTMSRLDADENTLVSTEGIPGAKNPQMRLVSESGLYSLILGSRKAEARDFKRWITHDVLPSIRKTGGYGKQSKLPSGAQLSAMLKTYGAKEAGLRVDHIIGYVPHVVRNQPIQIEERTLTPAEVEAGLLGIVERVTTKASNVAKAVTHRELVKEQSKLTQERLQGKLGI